MSDVTRPAPPSVRPTRAERAEEIRRYADDRLFASDIARLLGLAVATVLEIARDYRIPLPTKAEAVAASWQRPETLAKRRAAMIKAAHHHKERMAARRAGPNGAWRGAPAWVPNELREDWREFARTYGPAVANRELQKLVREMERAP